MFSNSERMPWSVLLDPLKQGPGPVKGRDQAGHQLFRISRGGESRVSSRSDHSEVTYIFSKPCTGLNLVKPAQMVRYDRHLMLQRGNRPQELKVASGVYRSSAIAQRYVRSPSYGRTTTRKPHPGHPLGPGSELPGLFYAHSALRYGARGADRVQAIFGKPVQAIRAPGDSVQIASIRSVPGQSVGPWYRLLPC